MHTFNHAQKMQARFRGTCHICSKPIQALVDMIVPVTSVTTAKGRHPWAHESCALETGRGVVADVPVPVEPKPEEPPKYRFFQDPPTSERQKSLLAENIEAVLKTLAAHPTAHFVLVGFDTAERATEFVSQQESFTQPLKSGDQINVTKQPVGSVPEVPELPAISAGATA